MDYKNNDLAVLTGFKAFDRMTRGLHGGDLVCLASRPSQGKTALALNMIANIVLAKNPKPVLLFSFEITRHAIMQRLLASEAKVALKDIRNGSFKPAHWKALTEAAFRFSEAPLHVIDKPSLSVPAIRSLACQLSSWLKRVGSELGLIVIDYVQLMRAASCGKSRGNEFSEISRGIKLMATDLKVPVVALSQLSAIRMEKGHDFHPQMSDLRDSGALGRDADIFAIIDRMSSHKQSGATVSKAKLIVTKNSRGASGIVKLNFDRSILLWF